MRLKAKNATPAKFAKDKRGVSALEFAILAPIFFTFMLGTMEVAHAFYSQGVMRFAIQEVARTIMVVQTLSEADLETAVEDKLSLLDDTHIQTLDVTIDDNGDNTTTATLEVTYTYDFEIPFVGSFPLTFDSKTEVLREEFPDPGN